MLRPFNPQVDFEVGLKSDGSVVIYPVGTSVDDGNPVWDSMTTFVVDTTGGGDLDANHTFKLPSPAVLPHDHYRFVYPVWWDMQGRPFRSHYTLSVLSSYNNSLVGDVLATLKQGEWADIEKTLWEDYPWMCTANGSLD